MRPAVKDSRIWREMLADMAGRGGARRRCQRGRQRGERTRQRTTIDNVKEEIEMRKQEKDEDEDDNDNDGGGSLLRVFVVALPLGEVENPGCHQVSRCMWPSETWCRIASH